MGDDVTKRRNGVYTCLDCLHSVTDKCFECKGWGRFVLDPETVNMTYTEKSDRHARKTKNSKK